MTLRTHKMLAVSTDENSAFSTGSITPENSASPSARHFFPCNEGSGTTLNDIVGGNSLATATNVWTPLQHVGNDANETTSGAFADFTTSDFAFFFVTEVDSTIDSVAIGGTTVGGIGCPCSFGSVIGGVVIAIDDDVTKIDFNFSALTTFGDTVGDVIGVGVVVDRSGLATAWLTDGTDIWTLTADATGIASFAIDAKITQKAKTYGMACWEFPGSVPSDYPDAFAEMYVNWQAGRKVLPSMWIDV